MLGEQRSAANLLRTQPGLPADFWEHSLSHGLMDEYLAGPGPRYAVFPDYTHQRPWAAAPDLIQAMRRRALRTLAERGLRPPPQKSRGRLEVGP